MPNEPTGKPSAYHTLPLVEVLDDYRPGGFHPVHLGDEFKDGRYVVLNKLGYGGASTVWLAYDTQVSQAIALSIVMSEGPTGSIERQLNTMKRLAHGPEDYPGRHNVLVPLDHFEIEGPNGRHLCFTTTVMGQSVSVATKRAQGVATRVLPLCKAKHAIKDLGNAISYMTACGVVHADLHPGNLLLNLSDEDIHGLERIREISGKPKTSPVCKVDGQPLAPNVPQYGVEAVFERDFDPSVFSGHIKVSDFGDSFFVDEPPSRTAHLGPYILPEYASPSSISSAADVWLLGCAIYQILSGHDLFGVPDDSAELVTSRFISMLGPPPQFLTSDWSAALGKPVSVHQSPTSSIKDRVSELVSGSESRGMQDRSQEFSHEDAARLTELLEALLVYDPANRPSIENVLQLPAWTYFG